jgi:hypothetical protein
MSMMFDRKKLSLTLAAATLPMVAAQAALHDRGRGLIYDDVWNITWMADANYGVTSGGIDPLLTFNGQVEWFDALNWAHWLEYGGYDDWRLPSALNLDGLLPQDQTNCPRVGHPCDNSELGYMFNVYMQVPGPSDHSILEARSSANLALFKNLQPSEYWTETLEGGYPLSQFVYTFDFGSGRTKMAQSGYFVSGFNNWAVAWAVRDGDVIDVSAVPEPQTAALMLAGVGLAGWAARRRRPGAIV